MTCGWLRDKEEKALASGRMSPEHSRASYLYAEGGWTKLAWGDHAPQPGLSYVSLAPWVTPSCFHILIPTLCLASFRVAPWVKSVRVGVEKSHQEKQISEF